MGRTHLKSWRYRHATYAVFFNNVAYYGTVPYLPFTLQEYRVSKQGLATLYSVALFSYGFGVVCAGGLRKTKNCAKAAHYLGVASVMFSLISALWRPLHPLLELACTVSVISTFRGWTELTTKRQIGIDSYRSPSSYMEATHRMMVLMNTGAIVGTMIQRYSTNSRLSPSLLWAAAAFLASTLALRRTAFPLSYPPGKTIATEVQRHTDLKRRKADSSIGETWLMGICSTTVAACYIQGETTLGIVLSHTNSVAHGPMMLNAIICGTAISCILSCPIIRAARRAFGVRSQVVIALVSLPSTFFLMAFAGGSNMSHILFFSGFLLGASEVAIFPVLSAWAQCLEDDALSGMHVSFGSIALVLGYFAGPLASAQMFAHMTAPTLWSIYGILSMLALLVVNAFLPNNI